MSSKKASEPVIVINNREGADSVFAEYAGALDAITVAEALLQRKIDRLRLAHSKRVAGHLASLKQCGEALEAWAETKPKDFGEKRSIDFINGRVGVRTGNRTLGLLSKIKWEDVLAKVKELFPRYVVKKESVDRDQILKDSGGDKPLLEAKELSALGVKVVQEERFYIEVKKL